VPTLHAPHADFVHSGTLSEAFVPVLGPFIVFLGIKNAVPAQQAQRLVTYSSDDSD
jgi:hypothetical protein